MDQPGVPDRPAYAACAWAFLFAAMSFYWALGGMVGVETLGVEIERQARERDPGLLATTWITGGLKAAAGLLALALVRPWGRALPRRLLVYLTWATGALFTLYGLANLVDHALIVTGAIAVPEGLGATAARWHLALWDPWWLLGGALFLLTAHSASHAAN
jgi:hypothetical protein